MRDYFLPHPETHKKAHLLSWHGLVIYILIFMLLQVGLSLYGSINPGVLGINSSVDQAKLIELTNIERAKNNLPSLRENTLLDRAAAAKAANMLAENYWAHYSPSGKDPWGFIQGEGYKFVYAGENLARNFYTSDDVVSAWMNSSTHRQNILNEKYQDIGIAVVEGTLAGQKTTLVVQEFGSQTGFVASAPQVVGPQPLSEQNARPNINGTALGLSPKVVISPSNFRLDPYLVTRGVGIAMLGLVAILLALDMYIMRRRAVVRLSSRHMSHFSIISIGLAAIIMVHPGAIL